MEKELVDVSLSLTLVEQILAPRDFAASLKHLVDPRLLL
jgi:hypothetical protein